MPSLRIEAAALIGALLAVALACLALFGGARAADFSPSDPPPGSGLYGSEPFADRPGFFRWAAAQARLELPNPGGASLLQLDLAAGPGRTTTLRLSGAVSAELALGSELRRYHLLAPPQFAERLRLDLAAPPFRPSGDPRELGVVLGAVSVRGGGSAPALVLLIALLLTLVFYTALRVALRPWLAALGAAALSSALLAFHAVNWPPGPPFAALAALAGMVAALAALGYHVALAAAARWRAAPATPGSAPWPLLLFGLGAYLGLGLWNQLRVHPGLTLDLGIYLEAGRAARAGASPYATLGLDELIIGVSFVYPPSSLPIFAALATLAPPTARALWLLGNFVLYLTALLSIAAALPGRPSRLALAALLGLGLGFAPFLEHLAIGQINSLMLLGLALFIHGQRDRTYAWVGDIGLATVILIKLTPAILLLWPLLRGDWPRLLRVGVAMALLSLPSLALFGPQPWLEFAAITPQLLAGAPRNPFNQALVAQIVVLTAPGSPAEAFALGLGRAFTPLLLVGWALVAWRRRSAAEDGAALAYGVAVLTLASSLIW
jgi:hypothetical protein